MSAEQYFNKISAIISTIQSTQKDKIESAGELFARSIASGGRVYIFGSGHSVIPVLDIFPRYGSFVGFYPIYDPRLMWFNIIGPGGPRELLWLERQEGYVRVVLSSYVLEARDSMLIFSHGGLNAAPVEMAMEARSKGLPVVSISSLQNYSQARATHSGGGVSGDQHWFMTASGTELSLAVAAGLIGYYLVYSIGVRVKIARHEQRRAKYR